MAENSDLSSQSFLYLYNFIFGNGKKATGSGPRPSFRPESSPSVPEFNAWTPVETFYKTVKDSFEADKAVAGRKFFRFGPKARIPTAGASANPQLRNALLDEAAANITGLPRGSQASALYEDWLSKHGPEMATQNAKPVTYGEGIYQAGFSAGDLKNPAKAFRREFKTFAKAYAWDRLEKGFIADQKYGAGNVRQGQPLYVLRHQVEEWGRVRTFLEDQRASELLAEAKKLGIPEQDARRYLKAKVEELNLKSKIGKIQNQIGPPSSRDLAQLPEYQASLAKLQTEHGSLIKGIDQKISSPLQKKFSDITGFIRGKAGYYDSLATRHWAAVWFAPTAAGDSLFGKNGRVWQAQQFVQSPLKYFIKNYLLKAGELPQWFPKWAKLPEWAQGLGPKAWEKLGDYGLAYRAGVFTPAGQAALARTNLAKLPIFQRLNGRMLSLMSRFEKVLAPVFKSLLSFGAGILKKVGLKALGAALGSVVPGIGTVAGLVIGAFAEKIIKGVLKGSLFVILGALSLVAIIFGTVIGLIILIAFALGANVTSSFGNITSAINSAIFQPVAAASQGDILVTVSSGKSRDIGANETVTITYGLVSFVNDAGPISLTSELDANLSVGVSTGGATVVGKVLSWPAVTLGKGESKTFIITITTSSTFNKDTIAVIKSSASSTKYSFSTSTFLNRAGNTVGADGRHAFPVLSGFFHSWSNCHGYPNFNAIDIFADGGTPVVAAISGTAEPRVEELGGPVVFLYGDDGLNYYYAHLRFDGRSSGRVSTGEIIGVIAASNEYYSKNNNVAHVHFSIDTRGIHNGPDTPAGDFLNAVEGTNKPKCTVGGATPG